MTFYDNPTDIKFINTYAPLDFSGWDKVNEYAGKQLDETKKQLAAADTIPDLNTPSQVDLQNYQENKAALQSKISNLAHNNLRDPDIQFQIQNLITNSNEAKNISTLSNSAKLLNEQMKQYQQNRPDATDYYNEQLKNYDTLKNGHLLPSSIPEYTAFPEEKYIKEINPDEVKREVQTQIASENGLGVSTSKTDNKELTSKKLAEKSYNLLTPSASDTPMRYDFTSKLRVNPEELSKYEIDPSNVPTKFEGKYLNRNGELASMELNYPNGKPEIVRGSDGGYYDYTKYRYDRLNSAAQSREFSSFSTAKDIKLPPAKKGRGLNGSDGSIPYSSATQYGMATDLHSKLADSSLFPNAASVYNNPEYKDLETKMEQAEANGDSSMAQKIRDRISSQYGSQIESGISKDFGSVYGTIVDKNGAIVGGLLNPKGIASIQRAKNMLTVPSASVDNYNAVVFGGADANQLVEKKSPLTNVVFDKGTKTSSGTTSGSNSSRVSSNGVDLGVTGFKATNQIKVQPASIAAFNAASALAGNKSSYKFGKLTGTPSDALQLYSEIISRDGIVPGSKSDGEVWIGSAQDAITTGKNDGKYEFNNSVPIYMSEDKLKARIMKLAGKEFDPSSKKDVAMANRYMQKLVDAKEIEPMEKSGVVKLNTYSKTPMFKSSGITNKMDATYANDFYKKYQQGLQEITF